MSIHDQRAVKWIVAIVAWLYCQVYCCSAHADRPTVVVPGLGTIAGAPSPFAPDVDDFLGIPYAKPPVGDLRWQPPLPHGPFNASGPLDGTTFGPRCWQPTTRHNDSSPMSEVRCAGPRRWPAFLLCPPCFTLCTCLSAFCPPSEPGIKLILSASTFIHCHNRIATTQ